MKPTRRSRGKRSKAIQEKTRVRKQLSPEADPSLDKVLSKIGRPADSDFTPDPFQMEALEAIEKGDCLVTAPTGAGKTWIAEQAIGAVLERGGRAWYASPLKALTNAKWVEFSGLFNGEKVGILTGDVKENPDAPVIVGTTEILRNQLYDAMYRGENLPCDLVILDEAHFLGDPDRGVVWEEIMIYLPSRINLLLLSATIGNAQEICLWLSSIRGKECRLVKESRRPVPLFPLFLRPSGKLFPYLEARKLHPKVAEFTGKRGHFRQPEGFLPEILQVLETFQLAPAIFFLKSRSECDGALLRCLEAGGGEEDEAFRADLEEQLLRYPYLREHRQLSLLKKTRLAAHHGGQLPAWKMLVESMMKKGHLRAIFATSTVAAGVNYPARTIVLFNSDLYNGREFSPLSATEFHQMTGRSGRRGLDKIGFMLALPGRFMNLEHLKRLFFRRPDNIASRIRNDFSMALNLLLSHSPAGIRDIFTRSLAAYQQNQEERKSKTVRGKSLWEDFLGHLAFLKQEGFVDDRDRLTENGIWASKLRLDQPLLIAEGIRREAFPRDDERLLAAIVALFVYDGDQEMEIDKKKQPRRLNAAYGRMMKAIGPMGRRLEAAGFPLTDFYYWTAVVIYDWARGYDWDHLVERTKITDGGLAMLIARTADNLRQLASLKETHPELADLAVRARAAILREPVIFL